MSPGPRSMSMSLRLALVVRGGGDRRVENRRTEDVAAVRNLMPHASSTLCALPLYATRQTQKYQ